VDWWVLTIGDEVRPAITEAIEDFEKLHPKITIKIQERSTDAHKDAVRQTAGSDSAPDMFFMWTGKGLGGEFVESGASLDLTKYYELYGWKDRFSEATLSSHTQFGGYHGVPYTQRGEAIYYRKSLFEKAGITSEPTTYEELVTAAEKLKSADIIPIQFGGTVNWHVMRLLDSLLETKCGADTHNDLVGLKADWAGEACVGEAFGELKTWGDNFFQPGYAGVTNDQAQADFFFPGKAAMALEGDWYLNVLTENGQDLDDFGMFRFPTGTGRLYGFSEGTYISASSKNAGAAAEFLDFFTRDEYEQEHLGSFGAISVNKNVVDSSPEPLNKEWHDFFGTATGLYVNNDQSLSLENTTEYWRIQNSVLGGKIKPEDAGATMQKFIDSHA